MQMLAVKSLRASCFYPVHVSPFFGDTERAPVVLRAILVKLPVLRLKLAHPLDFASTSLPLSPLTPTATDDLAWHRCPVKAPINQATWVSLPPLLTMRTTSPPYRRFGRSGHDQDRRTLTLLRAAAH